MTSSFDVREVKVIVPEAPVSVNHLYSQNAAGRRFLTTEGKAFKDLTKSMISRACSVSKTWGRASTEVYERGGYTRLEIWLALPGMRNKSWKAGPIVRTPSGSPRSPYKMLDGHNYVKIVADAVKEGTGIDDSLLQGSSEDKLLDWSGPPEVRITFQVWLPNSSP